MRAELFYKGYAEREQNQDTKGGLTKSEESMVKRRMKSEESVVKKKLVKTVVKLKKIC